MAKGTTIRMWRRSLLVLTTLVAVGFGVIILRLIYLQIFQGKSLQQMAMDQQLKDTLISASRGTIYDRNMKPLAQSATVWTVVLEPAYIKTEDKKHLIASSLSKILGLDENDLLEKASKKSYYVIVKRKIESDVKDKIIELQKEKSIRGGIRLIEDYKRYYPYGAFACSILGFTGFDSQGLAGIENSYDKELTGEPGRIITARNAVGTDMPFEYEQMIAAKNGQSLVLSIDEAVQHSLEKHLEEGRINNKAVNGATAIMMDVNTGEILGMAVKKDYDLNLPFELDEDAKRKLEELPEEERSKAKSEALNKQWRNKAVSDTYMPGSTFKTITASMALEDGVVNENSRFFCAGGVKIPGGKTVHCHKRSGHGDQSFQDGICHSCNPVFIALGQRLGAQRFYQYYKSFGLEQKTGIDLPGEANGLFFNHGGVKGAMSSTDLVVASFGQNFRITPIQMLVATAAAVNGGKIVNPHVVKQIIDDNGNIIKTTDHDIKRQVVSAQTSKRICDLLQKNVATGSGKNGGVPGYRIGGKTGTSEKIGDSAPGQKEYIASYCGFAPADNPKVALLVLYDTPKGDVYYGGLVAAPVAARIMNDVLPYLGVEKRYTEEELKELDTITPFLVGCSLWEAKSILSQNQLQCTIKGSGQSVVRQIPEVGQKIPRGGSVVLYTDDTNANKKVRVPNFLKLSLANANKLAFDSELNMSVLGVTKSSQGEIVSSGQSIEEGQMVAPGTVVVVEFVQKDSDIGTVITSD